MLKSLTRIGAAGALTVALVGGSALLAPAANAATHAVTYGYASMTEKVKVGSHTDTLKVKKTSSKVLNAAKDLYVPTTYKVTLLNSKKHVIYTKTASSWKALNAFIRVETHKQVSDAKLRHEIKGYLGKSTAASKKSFKAIYAKVSSEAGISFVAGMALIGLQNWITENPDATTFDAYTGDLTHTEYGITYTITGTPAAYTFVATDAATKIGITYHSDHTGGWTKNAVLGKFVLGAVTVTVSNP